MVEEIRQKLTCFDDPDFTFDPKQHKYHYKGNHYISATQFLQNFHKKFDTEYWSNKKAKERGITQEEILNEWQEKNDYANLVGTATHEWIENYFNRIHQELPTNLDIIDRINKFNKIYATHLYKLKPIVMEKRVFSKKYPIAGTIDSLFLYKDKIVIIDYKTNKKFTTDETQAFDKLLSPFDKHFQNHHNEYSIQISLYSAILKEWGFKVAGGYLLYIGPNDEAKFYRCHDFVKTLEDYLPQHNF